MEPTPGPRIQIAEDAFVPRPKPSPLPKILGASALLIVGIGVGGYFYFAPESHIAMTWTEDPAIPELIYNTVHDKRRDFHGSQVMCREFAMWSDQINEQLIKAGPKAPEIAKKAYLHWEPIDSAFNALTNLKPDPGDAADTLALCWKHVKSMGQYLDDVGAGRTTPDKRIEPWMKEARVAARDR